MAGQLEALVPMPNESIGGSAETEVREVAVKPTGPPAPWAVITATAAACRRKAERSRSGEESGGERRSGVAVMELSCCERGRGDPLMHNSRDSACWRCGRGRRGPARRVVFPLPGGQADYRWLTQSSR